MLWHGVCDEMVFNTLGLWSCAIGRSSISQSFQVLVAAFQERHRILTFSLQVTFKNQHGLQSSAAELLNFCKNWVLLLRRIRVTEVFVNLVLNNGKQLLCN